MSGQFLIKSSDPILLEKATRVAQEFARQYMREKVVGIVFLGAIVRGYFDQSADIDIAIFKKQGSEIALAGKYLEVEGLEIHRHLADYEVELAASWDMAKRWTFSEGQVWYDPQGKISKLLAEKVPLKAPEKRRLLMEGLALSEWYANRLARLWVERGDMVSAHHMFAQGLDYFFEMLFALNDQLVADAKWRYYCVSKLAVLPPRFLDLVKETMTLHAFSVEEIARRQTAFMEMWREMAPVVEHEVQMSYDEIRRIV